MHNGDIEMTTQETREQYQRDVSDLADELLDAAIARGESFSEGLCNWAISQAEREVAA